jgi:hypothetical protein
MTPEERRKRVEYVAKMAELGMLAEVEYDREEWRAQHEAGELPTVESPSGDRHTSSPKTSRRRSA